MKNIIFNFYNILIDKYYIKDNKIFFHYNKEEFFFEKIENDVNIIEKIYQYGLENKISMYEIILNKNRKLFSKFDKDNYCLIKIKGLINYSIGINELSFYPLGDKEINWGKLWGMRLDYYEIQIRELAKKYQDVINSFGFFSGLAENAIFYYNLSLKTFNDTKFFSIAHYRIKYPNYLIDYLNPCNMIIDYSVRDIAEYIKSYVFSNDYDINNVISYLNQLNINKLMFNLLYSRLLYPSYYFDTFDNIILNDGKDKDVINILNKIEEYMYLLKIIYNRYKDIYSLFNINWINKNVEG